MEIFPSRISYILIIAIAIINAILIYNSNIIFPVDQLLTPAISSAILLFISIILFSVNYTILTLKIIMTKIAYIFQGIIFLQLAWINVRVLNHASMALSFPYADDILINWDRFLNFNWKQYFYFVQNNEIVKTVFDYSYTSLTFFSFWSFIILVVQKDLKRTCFFLETFLFTAVICTAIGMFFPAKAAVAMYYGDAKTLANLDTLPGVYHIEAMQRLRSGLPFSLDLNDLPGLVTFPSFHTAAGIILVISFWRTALFPVILLYSATMIASTPVLGGHYFVDLIGGTMVAVLVAFAFGALPAYRGLFVQAGTELPSTRPATTG